MTSESIEVRPVPGRFEVVVDGEPAGFAAFRDSAEIRTFDHTEIDPEQGGKGLGGKLIRGALDQTRTAGLQVNPRCSFVRDFIAKHEEYADLVVA